MNEVFVKLLPDNSEIEKLALQHIIVDKNFISKLKSDYFFKEENKNLFASLLHAHENGIAFDKELVKRFCSLSKQYVDESYLDTVFSSLPKDGAHAKYVSQQLKNSYLQYVSLQHLEELVSIATDKKSFSVDKIKKKILDLNDKIIDSESSLLLDGGNLADDYMSIMQKRKEGVVNRSLGFKIFNQYITRPASPGEMTGIVANKGSGKSIFVKCIEKELVEDRVCVVSINLEMSEESCLDRKMCLETGYPLREIIKMSNDSIEEDLEKELVKLRENNYYLFYKESELSLTNLDSILYEAKEIFRKKGVLPEDEYMVVVIDLLDMVEEFSDSDSSYKIKKAINKLHQITRKHKIHTINVIQANENKFRGGKIFKKPDELDYYKVGLEDIEGSASFAQRCRVIMTLTRPLQLKKRYFPEQMEQWELETDFINCNIVKQNDGPEGFLQFVFGDNFNIYPFKD
jgi:replicative DNA helicase